MKLFIVSVTVMIVLAGFVWIAWGNPAMLPKHEGYPMDKAVSPVTGQSLANDPGQRSAGGANALAGAAGAEDAHVSQKLTDPDNARLLEKPGAGVLPKVEGPQIKIEPPVKEATRMK